MRTYKLLGGHRQKAVVAVPLSPGASYKQVIMTLATSGAYSGHPRLGVGGNHKIREATLIT